MCSAKTLDRRLNMCAVVNWPAAAQGRGASFGHHGEIFQGVVEQADKGLRRVLVTLPCARYASTATFLPNVETVLAVTRPDRVKALKAAQHTLSLMGVGRGGGLLAINSNIPMGHGLGSSSADVVAAIRSVANAFGMTLSPETIAGLAVRAEMASDALMFEDYPVLFAHREGAVLETFGAPLPEMDVLSIRDGANSAAVDTLALAAPCYSARDVEEFRVLLGVLRCAILDGDAERVGAVASASAHINQRFLNKPNLEQVESVGMHHGALGIQVAHSGTVMGLLFRKGDRKGVHRTRQALIRQLGESVKMELFSLIGTRGICPSSWSSGGKRAVRTGPYAVESNGSHAWTL